MGGVGVGIDFIIIELFFFQNKVKNKVREVI